jgi:hypothetical protein
LSIEGMWTFRSGTVDNPEELIFGGIVTLETQRVFGGDSAIAYHGTYETANGVFRARVRAWTWNTALDPEEWSSAFNMGLFIDHIVIVEGTIEGETVVGAVWREAAPDQQLPARMEKIAELP